MPEQPRFKGADPEELLRNIYGSTGCDYEEITKSRPHQLEGLAFALYHRRALLYYWMRLGKSKIALDWCAHLQRSNLATRKGLIIAHAPLAADDVWPGQVTRHSTLRAISIKSGPGAPDKLIDALESDADLIILSRSTIQALFSDKRLSRKGVPKLYPSFDLLGLVAEYFDHCVIDEIHFYSDPYGLQFGIINALIAHCKFRLGMTGTPIGRDTFPVWAQAFLVDEGRHFGYQYRFFQEAFGKKSYYSKTSYQLVFDKKKLPVFQYKLDALALSYGKNEVKSAEVFAGVIDLRMSPDQREAYNAACDALLKMRMDDTAEIENIFVKLRMIASGFLPFVDEDGKRRILHFRDSVKLGWLREFIAEIPSGMRCLIFHEFIHTGELICQVLAESKITYAWLHGDTKDKPAELARFKSGTAQILVANTATGGTSIDIPEVDYMCFFESPCDPRVRAQAQARPMARSLDRPLVLDDLICAPIEDKILGFINDGADLMRALLHGKRRDLHGFLRAK